MKVMTVSGAAMAAAAAGLFVSSMAVAPTAAGAKPAFGHCMGANACKGMSACKGGKPGLNACKGQGFAMLTKGACSKAGHRFEKA